MTSSANAPKGRPLVMAILVLVASGSIASARSGPTDTAPYTEPYRPQFHFSPAKNWMNDPNGLVYYDGEYHLFYQYNPFGDKWGHMSWGHAVTTDLVHWTHLPVALAEENGVMIFSGSAVVDERNTSGFGKDGKPPMVAIYTGWKPVGFNQAQYIAYSTDRGRTWTKYAGNPVLDIGSTEFRDPKVFWYEPAKRWIMVLVLAAERRVRFYGSPDLKQWTRLSEFGPAAAIGGVWECPDLFELPVDGARGQKRWVLGVNINPGGRWGGSAGQYFVGNFDGTTFTLDEPPSAAAPPKGDVLADFDGTTYGDWEIAGTAFGTAPESGVANSGVGGDEAQGMLTSPAFKLSRPYIGFQVGGANKLNELAVNLVVDGQVVRTASGWVGDMLDWASWDVREFAGKQAKIQIVDRATGGGDHILVDRITLSDSPVLGSKDYAQWVDYGKDFYAVVSWNNVPRKDGRRLWIGWVNNWEYGQDVPTSPWRSMMSVPREVRLRKYPEGIRLVQVPVTEMAKQRRERVSVSNLTVAPGSDPLASKGLKGRALEIVATFEPGTATEFGLKVCKGGSEETLVGYDVAASEGFIDRTRSGKVDFDPRFPGRHAGPLPVEKNRVKLHVFVDWSSVELLGNDGRLSITDMIFPSAGSDRVEAYAKGGSAKLVSLEAWRVESTWTAPKR